MRCQKAKNCWPMLAAKSMESKLNQQDQAAADRAEYEWKQRRIREAVAAYKRWEQQQRRSFN